MEERRKITQRITIEDPEIWEMIEKIRTLPEYSKSLNKVFNEGLKLGLPQLHNKLYPKEEVKKKEVRTKSQQELEIDAKRCEYFAELAKSLKEILINLIVNKNTYNQTHEMLRRTFNDEPIENDKILLGHYSDAPKFLQDYERRGLKNLNKK